MPDEWDNCFDPAMGLNPEAFSHTFCRVCRNSACDRSSGEGLKWLKRISTQADRLLNNPKFADPSDPRFADIRNIEFPSALREAMRIEINERRGDWSIPSETELVGLTAEMAAPAPIIAAPLAVKPEPKVLQRFEIKGTQNQTYIVTQVEGVTPQWQCTCKAFEFKRTAVCKHIEQAMTLVPEEPPAVPVGFQAPMDPIPGRAFYPGKGNIPMPSGGIMIDGSTPPAPKDRTRTPVDNPWAPPPPKPNVIPVGGKVVMGGPKKDPT